MLEGSAHDTFNDIVQLVALRYVRVMHYLRMFKPVRCTLSHVVPLNTCQEWYLSKLGVQRCGW